ncbi:TRL-like family protein [Leptospira sp. 2 VSF19]|uniref:TRL-like family protein n=1 Tax=Leptospira soteropolitanensis TaxID=2950025 RepID=A0AAW5VIP9_9LEPT|nr:TRL-like family protein [Leptospira soteropolitanensis]MCW7491490.1 TRL-like family protein [Leptospira soteropolitanensis]MCW7499074.1 TRL-like family protein [Leptospira soteropolitanensis]MCW7521334.1 TRL-like family protein [Leptospira soteropolitanensis]MCW7525178.1 TRL-like family protein [Leptospira soteropolitanensis]MCW7529045.1 TRL-like family protein [Leptospira soteropolitanensis]
MSRHFILSILFVLFSNLFFGNCASPGFGPRGLIYTKTKIGIFGTGESSKRRATSCVHSVLGLLSFGNASLEFLKSRSKIQNVTETNWTTFAILGVYANLCVEISGNE